MPKAIVVRDNIGDSYKLTSRYMVDEDDFYRLSRSEVRRLFKTRVGKQTEVVGSYYNSEIGERSRIWWEGLREGRNYFSVGCKDFYGADVNILRRWANGR